MKYALPFSKWDKDQIIKMIKENGFVFENEYGGTFQFNHPEADRKGNFHLNYVLYLHRTMLCVCNPNIRISPSIKSHKQLNEYLKDLYENGWQHKWEVA